MNRYRIKYYDYDGGIREMELDAPSADDALTMYEVQTGGSRRRNRSSAWTVRYDVAGIECIAENVPSTGSSPYRG